jgi:outer membrane receptor protein involved in Fe transport
MKASLQVRVRAIDWFVSGWAPTAALAQQANERRQPRSVDTNAIIVTARRRAESLQTTPVAITAISGDAGKQGFSQYRRFDRRGAGLADHPAEFGRAGGQSCRSAA